MACPVPASCPVATTRICERDVHQDRDIAPIRLFQMVVHVQLNFTRTENSLNKKEPKKGS